jgi:hypothetical protein
MISGKVLHELPPRSLESHQMAASSQRKIASNRDNALHSTGPRTAGGKARSKLNALKHGLLSEQVVLPGEDPRAFEAEQAAWTSDWQPRSHTRAILVERAAATSWRLRRCVRLEGVRLQTLAEANLAVYDRSVENRINGQIHHLRASPAETVSVLMSDAPGIEMLIDSWKDLADAAAVPGAWTDLASHHDCMLLLMGWEPEVGYVETGPVAETSFRLLITNDPEMGEHDDGPLTPEEAENAASVVGEHCQVMLADLAIARARCPDPDIERFAYVDERSIDCSDAGKSLQRYETTLDRSLRATISQLIQLEKTGADLAEDPDSLEVAFVQPPAPNEPNAIPSPAPNEAKVEALEVASAPNEPNGEVSRTVRRDREGRIWPVEGGPDRPTGDVPTGIDQA